LNCCCCCSSSWSRKNYLVFNNNRSSFSLSDATSAALACTWISSKFVTFRLTSFHLSCNSFSVLFFHPLRFERARLKSPSGKVARVCNEHRLPHSVVSRWRNAMSEKESLKLVTRSISIIGRSKSNFVFANLFIIFITIALTKLNYKSQQKICFLFLSFSSFCVCVYIYI